MANKVGLTLAIMFGGVHALWAGVVALGYAPTVINFMARLHFVQVSYRVMTFNITTALMLVAMTAVAGYIVGYLFVTIHNALNR